MLCSRCNQKQANVFFSQSINGQTEEYNLCESCAKETGIFDKGADMFGFEQAFSPMEFLASLLGEERQPIIQARETILKCKQCGMTFQEFSKVGKFGCANCYETFGDLLPPVLKRIHGNSGHHGKVPGRAVEQIGKNHELDDLRKKLKNAIDAEEYEKAAEIRDKIKTLDNP